MADRSDERRHKSLVIETIWIFLRSILGQGRFLALVFLLLLCFIVVLGAYSVYSWTSREAYIRVSELNARQLGNLETMMGMLDRLRAEVDELRKFFFEKRSSI